MSNKVKAAYISLAVVTVMTASKFLLYYLSGSLAVLSEAWHGFSDIATTLLVLVSIARVRRTPEGPSEKDDDGRSRGRANRILGRIFRNRPLPEQSP